MAPIPCFRSGSQGIFALGGKGCSVQNNHRKLLGLSVNSLDIPMAEPTLTQVFGAGATQDSESFTITKADLASAGYTPSASDSAEKILAAIIDKARQSLTSTAADTNADQSIVFDDSPFFSGTERNNTRYTRLSLTVNFDTAVSVTGIVPNNY